MAFGLFHSSWRPCSTAWAFFRHGFISLVARPTWRLSSGRRGNNPDFGDNSSGLFFPVVVLSFRGAFGQIQIDLICCNSLLLIFPRSLFNCDVFHLHHHACSFVPDILRAASTNLILAIVQILAGIAQTVVSYQLRSYLKLGETKPITTVQSAASLACDLLITIYLYLFLTSQKGEMMKTNFMIDMLIYDAINRGMLTALSSGINMVLFLALPDTFWFFLGLAPSSKLYMNSFLTSYVLVSAVPVDASPFAQAQHTPAHPGQRCLPRQRLDVDPADNCIRRDGPVWIMFEGGSG
ncbi:hypothetical protein B0H13DRAFT_1917778 [Mycena leptocephala]|nr:hypothetical protein B0H13DRAFT_1917778 [Mycena leptocephala]